MKLPSRPPAGLPGEVAQAVQLLGDLFDLVDASAVYPCRGHSDLVRICVEVRIGNTRPGRGASTDAAAVSGGRVGAELETAPPRPATTTTTTGDEGRWVS